MSRERQSASSARCITSSSWWTAAARAIPRREHPAAAAALPRRGRGICVQSGRRRLTTLYFRGEVINMPSGGKERSVSDVIMFTAQ